jgi:hypothetical protein
MCTKALGTACAIAKSFAEPLERLSQHFPAKDALMELTRKVTEDIPLNPDRWQENSVGGVGMASSFPLVPGDFSDTANGSSSSSSSESEGDSGLDGLEDQEDLFARYESSVWISPVQSCKRKMPKLHIVHDEIDSKYKTACGRTLAITAERFLGWSATLGAPYEWCPGCWKLLPTELKDTVPN